MHEAQQMTRAGLSDADQMFHPGKLVLATGAEPQTLDIPGAELAQISDGVFEWTRIPARLVIIGGGYIGSEFAAIFNALGADVHLVTDGPRILEEFYGPAVACAQQQMERAGVTLHKQMKPTRIDRNGDDLVVTLENGERLSAEKVLMAIGRSPSVAGTGADFLDTAKNGALCVDDRFETSPRGIFAVGDVADRLPLTPVARRDGDSFARIAFGSDTEVIDLSLVARTAFILPPLAQVGRFVGEKGTRSDPLRHQVLDDGTGDTAFYQVAVENEKIAGIALVHEAAAEIIAPFAALLGTQADKNALQCATGVHPSFSEAIVGD